MPGRTAWPIEGASWAPEQRHPCRGLANVAGFVQIGGVTRAEEWARAVQLAEEQVARSAQWYGWSDGDLRAEVDRRSEAHDAACSALSVAHAAVCSATTAVLAASDLEHEVRAELERRGDERAFQEEYAAKRREGVPTQGSG